MELISQEALRDGKSSLEAILERMLLTITDGGQ